MTSLKSTEEAMDISEASYITPPISPVKTLQKTISPISESAESVVGLSRSKQKALFKSAEMRDAVISLFYLT